MERVYMTTNVLNRIAQLNHDINQVIAIGASYRGLDVKPLVRQLQLVRAEAHAAHANQVLEDSGITLEY